MMKSSRLFCCAYKRKGYFYVLGVMVTCCVINWGFGMRYLCQMHVFNHSCSPLMPLVGGLSFLRDDGTGEGGD